MKRFLLINSPIFWDGQREKEQYLPPLGLAYIATQLARNGIQVELFDSVKKGASVNEIINIINMSSFDFVGINIFTQNYTSVKYIVESIHRDCECFIGGQVVKSIYKDILSWKTKMTMHIIIGEGELIIPAIVSNASAVIPVECDGTKKVYNVNKESVFFPKELSGLELDRKFIPDEMAINHYGDMEGVIVTSRGCIYDCAFCGGARSVNPDIFPRIRSEQSIMNELDEMIDLYPEMKSVRILDDLFIRDRNSIEKAIRIFLKYPELVWRGMAHVNTLKNSLDLLCELKACGCKELFIGIESGSEGIRRMINKEGSVDDVLKVASSVLSAGIDLKGYFIFGFPDETEADCRQTFNLARKIHEFSGTTRGNFRTSVFQFRPYHGTKLYNRIVDTSGIIHDSLINEEVCCFEGRRQFNSSFGNYSEVTDEQLNNYIIRTQEL